jgi:hypothetical protein
VVSVLSLAVEQALHHRPGVFRPAVIVRIDGVDVSRVDGDDGPGPWDALVPVNRSVATGEVTTATISCCPGCGPECCAVEVRIRREGETEEPDECQIRVRAAWDAERPDESAAAARTMLAGPAADRPAEWLNMQPECEVPPVYAGPFWRRAAR